MQRHAQGDSGATAVEYLGMLVVVAAVMAAITLTDAGKSIGDKIRCVVSSVTGDGGCGGGNDQAEKPLTDQDFEPSICQTHSQAGTQGGKVKASFRSLGLELGAEYGFEETTYQANTDVNKDGKVDENDQQVHLSFTDTGSLKGKVEPKARVKIGEVGKDKVELAAGISVTKGDTWVFDSPEEAEQFRKDIEEYKKLDRINDASNLSPLVGGATEIGRWFGKGPKAEEDRLKERIEEKLGDKHITSQKLSGEVSGSAGLQFGPGIAKDPDDDSGSGNGNGNGNGDNDGDNDGDGDGDTTPSKPELGAEAGVNVSLSQDVILTQNHMKNTDSYTYSATAQGGVSASGQAGPAEVGGELSGARTGAITISVDQETGELRAITMTQTTESKAEASAGLKGGPEKGTGSAKGKGGGSDIDVITNRVLFEEGQVSKEEADRIKLQLFAGGGTGKAFEYMFTQPPAPTRDPGADDPFGHLMYTQGQSSKTQYTNVSDAEEYGVDINLGIAGVGGSYTSSSSEKTLDKAEFLGAPRNGERSYVPYSYCAN